MIWNSLLDKEILASFCCIFVLRAIVQWVRDWSLICFMGPEVLPLFLFPDGKMLLLLDLVTVSQLEGITCC